MLMPDFPLEPKDLLALSIARDAACKKLGFGDASLDVAKRERVSFLIRALVLKVEHDIDVLHRRAIIHFRNTSSPS